MADLHGNEPVTFDNGAADALISALTGSASAIEGQVGSRLSFVTTASEEFQGAFAALFQANAEAGRGGAGQLVSTMNTVAGWVRTMQVSAEKENGRRKRAREFDERQANKNIFDDVHDWFTGPEERPHEPVEARPSFQPATVSPRRGVLRRPVLVAGVVAGRRRRSRRICGPVRPGPLGWMIS